jgi:hypothetical protein
MVQAYEGGHAQLESVRSGRNNSGVVQPVGRAVAFDTGGGTTELAFRALTGAGDTILGVLLSDQTIPQNVVIANGGVLANAMASIVARGEVWVSVEQAVTPVSPVFTRHTLAGATGTNPAVGKFRTDADTAKAVAVANARFLTSAAAGGLALLQINIP